MSTIKLFWNDNLIKSSLIISLTVLVTFVIIGTIIPIETPELISHTQYTFMDIFTNNIREVGFSIIKILTFGIFNLIDLLINGVLLGITINYSLNEFGLYTMFTRLFIHGVLEIPVIIITNSFGFIPLLLLRHNELQNCKFYIKYVVISTLICSILTLFAALIESYII